MNRQETLQKLYKESGLSEVLKYKTETDHPESDHSSLKFIPNEFRIRAIEIWEPDKGKFFRIYHSPKIAPEIKETINEIPGRIKSLQKVFDFEGDHLEVCKQMLSILSSGTTIDAAKKNVVLTKNKKYEGLALPDVDTSDIEVMGRVFTWKEIIAIDEDQSSDNEIKKVLSQEGVHLQRSTDGTARYVGSAYGAGGILSRWLKHLTSNGNAKHLNLFVLENGYSNILFTVLEFTDKDNALKVERKWKDILGTQNNGPYDSYRLNSN